MPGPPPVHSRRPQRSPTLGRFFCGSDDERGQAPLRRLLHINAMISAIPISTFTPAITTPRQTSAGMISDWNLEWLADTGLPYAKGYPQIDHAGAENSFLPNVQKCT